MKNLKKLIEKARKNGVFIVVEGPDGSGKGYQTEALVRWLKKKYPGRRILLTHEPWERERNGKWIRAALNGDRSKVNPADSEIFQRMYVDNRIGHQIMQILEVLAEGGIVVCDRERLSTLAYGHAYGVSIELMLEWHKEVPIKPDVFIFLDTECKVCIERMKARGDEPEYFDRPDKVARVIVAYRHVVSNVCVGTPIILVNNGRSKPEVRDDIRKIAEDTINRVDNAA